MTHGTNGRARRRGVRRREGRGPGRPSADIAHWAGCIAEGQKPILSAEHARHVVEIMGKAVIASRTGEAQMLTTRF